MRELIYFIGSLAGAALLTALGIIGAPAFGAWTVVAYVAALVLVLCAIWLLVDLFGRTARQKMLPLIGMVIFGIGFAGCGAWFFWPMVSSSPPPAKQDRWTWNALTAAEMDNLYSKLRSIPRSSVEIACNKAECTALADSFDNLFRRLGWPSVIGDGGMLAVGVTGVYIGPRDDAAIALKEAIETTTAIRPDLEEKQRDKGTTHPFMLIIGTKPASMPSGPFIPAPAPTPKIIAPPMPSVPQDSKPSPQADGPIVWFRPDDVESVFGFLQAPDGGMLVSNLRADGTSKVQSPMTNIKAWFEAQLSKEPIVLEFVNYDPDPRRDFIPTSERFIEPGANFGLGYLVPRIDSKNPRGVSVSDFLRIYGGLTFHFEYQLNGVPKNYSYAYSYETITQMLRDRERKWNEDHKRHPGLGEYKP